MPRSSSRSSSPANGRLLLSQPAAAKRRRIGIRKGSKDVEIAVFAKVEDAVIILGLLALSRITSSGIAAPELREGSDEIELALAGRLPRVVGDGDIRGILDAEPAGLSRLLEVLRTETNDGRASPLTR